MADSASSLVERFHVYRALRRHCRPARLPGPWGHRAAERSCRRCPDDPTTMLVELAAMFPPQVLIESGVAVFGSEGKLQPSPLLVPGGGWLVFLRGPHGPTFDVLTPSGSLSGALPVLSAWQDSRTQQAFERWERMLVADTLDDVVVLRSLGFAAAPWTGLDDLRPDDLAALCAALGWGLEGPPEPHPDCRPDAVDDLLASAPQQPGPSAAEEPVPLILAGWSPARLHAEASPAIDAISQKFRALYRRGLTRMELGVWRPSREYLDRLGLQLEVFRDAVSAAQLTDEMFADLDQNTFDLLVEPVATPQAPPANLQEAWDALFRVEREAAAGRVNADEVARLQMAFDDFLERDLLRPLLRPGNDPLSANLRLVLQQLSRLFHRATRQADGTLQRLPAQALAMGELSRLVGPLVQVASRILTLSREVRTCDHEAGRRPAWCRSSAWETLN